MALAASACSMTHPASYSGKGSSLQTLFLEVMFVLLASHRVACRLPLPAKTGSGFYAGLQGKQVRAGDISEMPFPKSPGSGEVSHNPPHRLRVTLDSEPHGPKKHKGVDLHHSTGMNMGGLILNSLT